MENTEASADEIDNQYKSLLIMVANAIKNNAKVREKAIEINRFKRVTTLSVTSYSILIKNYTRVLLALTSAITVMMRQSE